MAANSGINSAATNNMVMAGPKRKSHNQDAAMMATEHPYFDLETQAVAASHGLDDQQLKAEDDAIG